MIHMLQKDGRIMHFDIIVETNYPTEKTIEYTLQNVTKRRTKK